MESPPTPQSLRIAVVMRSIPSIGTDGPSRYLLEILKHLNRSGAEVDLYVFDPVIGPFRGRRLEPELTQLGKWRLKGCVSVRSKYRRVLDLKWFLRKCGLRELWAAPMTDSEVRWMSRCLRRRHYRCVIGNYLYTAPITRHLQAGSRFLAILHDALSERYVTFSECGDANTMFPWTPELEARYLKMAQNVICISESDLSAIRGIADASVKSGVLTWAPPEMADYSHSPGHNVLFVGSRHRPNAAGINWFIEKCWPAICNQVPSARLVICGAVGQEVTQGAPGIIVKGYVDDLKTEYEQAAVVIVPILYGSGFKIKLGEALGYGKAVVSTAEGARGLESMANVIYRLAESEAAFINATLSFLNTHEERQRFGSRAYEWYARQRGETEAFKYFDSQVGIDKFALIKSLA